MTAAVKLAVELVGPDGARVIGYVRRQGDEGAACIGVRKLLHRSAYYCKGLLEKLTAAGLLEYTTNKRWRVHVASTSASRR